MKILAENKQLNQILESIDEFLESPSSKNERDISLLKSTRRKLLNRPNAELLDEEKRALDKYNLTKGEIQRFKDCNTKNIDDTKQRANKLLKRDESLKEGFADARPNHSKLQDMIDSGLVNVSSLADELLSWLSDDDVGEFANAYGYFDDIEDDEDEDLDESKSLKEDTVKQGNYWVNKGEEGTHGKFKTKKVADAQRKAMFANGYKAEGLDDDFFNSRHNDSHLVDVANKEKTIYIGDTPIKVLLSKFINKTSNMLGGGSKVSQAGVQFDNNNVIIATTERDADKFYNGIPDKFTSIDEFIKYIKDFGYDKDDTSEVPNPFDKFIAAISKKVGIALDECDDNIDGLERFY